MTRVVVVASSAVMRAGLEALARSIPGLHVTGALPDYDGAEALRPDVIVTTEPWEDAPEAAIVALSRDARASWTAEAARHGVRAILARDASQEAIAAAVEAAANDLAVVDPRELQGWLGSAAPAQVHVPDGARELTAREAEVLRMLADGAANKVIAWKLSLSEHTVKFHVGSILAKLGAASRAEAVSIGIRRGLVPL
jgi:two-component system, NarL family, response regulator YdfI